MTNSIDEYLEMQYEYHLWVSNYGKCSDLAVVDVLQEEDYNVLIVQYRGY